MFRTGKHIISRSANVAASRFISATIGRTWRQPLATGERGRPLVYPDGVIHLGLVLQQVYRLPLRQTVGLLRSVLDLAGLKALPVPDPSTLCRRRRGVALPAWPKAGGCIVVAGVVTSCQKHDSQVLGDVLAVAQPQPGTVVIGGCATLRPSGIMLC